MNLKMVNNHNRNNLTKNTVTTTTKRKIKIHFSHHPQIQIYDYISVYIIMIHIRIYQRNSRAWKLALIIISVIVLFNVSSSRFCILESICFSKIRSSRASCFYLNLCLLLWLRLRHEWHVLWNSLDVALKELFIDLF
jgi:hypothetical protein